MKSHSSRQTHKRTTTLAHYSAAAYLSTATHNFLIEILNRVPRPTVIKIQRVRCERSQTVPPRPCRPNVFFNELTKARTRKSIIGRRIQCRLMALLAPGTRLQAPLRMRFNLTKKINSV
ncbi:hypothetical protein EVAR_73514_1 [Eumeta japonica]|uniref:Uncharacterized protein n=1 Tax=Eumeta variegata TaxID=151549 RepID=A0A4C1TFT0_EUMVA|nr:hypothetical protein EVAR_73514_1 [Eumeta japonica]